LSKRRQCLSSVLGRHEEKTSFAARPMSTEAGGMQERMRRNVVERLPLQVDATVATAPKRQNGDEAPTAPVLCAMLVDCTMRS